MRILMLNPPFLPKFSRTSRSPAVSKGGCVYYPIWMAYATGVLEKEGHEVKLIDAPAENKTIEDILGIAKEFRPELVVLDTSTPSIKADIATLEKIKKENKCFGVLVGTHVSALPIETMKQSNAIDAIAIQEYDYTLKELAAELEKKKTNLGKIKGIVFRKGKKIIQNENRELIGNLDELPFVSEVYKKHLKTRNYFYPANLYPEITIITGRGCPFQCTYCVLPQVFTMRGYRARNVKSVLEEFLYIHKNFPEVKEIFIEDDTFTANPKRVREFCAELLKTGKKFVWSCNARADVDLETLKAMKKAGCRLLCVGFESGAQEVLDSIKKGTKIEVIRRFMKDSKKAKILVHGCFMIGNFADTKETIMKTIEFAKELDPDSAQFFPIMVYPGTEAYEQFEKKGWIKAKNFEEWLDEKGSHNCVVSRPGLSNDELVALCDEGRKKFYLRPKYITRKVLQGITTPKELPRLFKASKTFFKYLFKG